MIHPRRRAASCARDLKSKGESVDFQEVFRCLLSLTASPTFLVFDALNGWEESHSVVVENVPPLGFV